jgi:hypothetical protein
MITILGSLTGLIGSAMVLATGQPYFAGIAMVGFGVCFLAELFRERTNLG